ncbi:MAG: hypothetical protein AABM43_01760 [Actinomycetota bacterium]
MSDLMFGDLGGAEEVRIFDRRLAATAEKYATDESPEHRRRMVALIRERGACWRAEHARRTNALTALLEVDDDAAADFATELAMLADGERAVQ